MLLSAAGLLASTLASASSGKYSFSRLAFHGAAVLLCCVICAIAWQVKNNSRLSNWWQTQGGTKFWAILISIAAGCLLAGWIIIWTPLESFGGLYYYALELLPYFVWFAWTSAAALGLLLAARFGVNLKQVWDHVKNERLAFKISAIAMLIFALLAVLAAFRVVGVKPGQEDFWYGAGAPVLAFPSQASLFIGLGLSALCCILAARVPIRSKWLDLILFLLIWAFSAWLWAREPAKPNFNITQPVPPNYEYYPDYDARTFDLMSQFALIGQGINNSIFYDRALYPALLVYLHNLAGQDYQRTMALQAVLYGVLPALLYLIGKSIFNRAAGVAIGVLTSLRELDHLLVGNIINTSHPKQMLTEFPTAILLTISALLIIKWVQKPERNWHLAGLAGGLLGLSTLLRPHPLLLILMLIALFILVYRRRARLWLGLSSLCIAAAILSVLPWTQFSGHDVSIADLYLGRMKSVIQERYPQIFKPPSNPVPSPASRSAPSPTPSTVMVTANPAETTSPPGAEKSVLVFTLDNFLNNLVSSIQTLPVTPYFLDASTVVKKTDNFWTPYWDGSLTAWAKVLLPVNLMLVALGIGFAWNRSRLAGLIPLIFMLTYFASNALARTSGGRYIVPVDWVVVLYYMIGLVAAAGFIMALFGKAAVSSSLENQKIADLHPINPKISAPAPLTGRSSWWKSTSAILLASFCLGSLIPIAQYINPTRFQTLSTDQLTTEFFARAGQSNGVSQLELQQFLSKPDAIILMGRSLYPRQFYKNQGLTISIYNFYQPLPYPRTLFTIIGAMGERVVILPRTSAAGIANSTDVLVLGCKKNGYIQAWAVVNLENNQVFNPLPSTKLLPCPLPEPVCDNNKNCH